HTPSYVTVTTYTTYTRPLSHSFYLYYLHLHLPSCFFFFTHTATTEIYTLSLHDALPISYQNLTRKLRPSCMVILSIATGSLRPRSEEHTSELQSRFDLVCRLLLEKKKKKKR